MSIFSRLYASRKNRLDKWIAALGKHIDTVTKRASSRSNPTPLLADGFDVLSHNPVVWQFPDGHSAPISNFASQQNWLRTLCAMSVITGENNYQQQAATQTAYFLANFVDAHSGLFFWGGHRFINLDTLQSEGPQSKALVHELKHHLPYYALLHRIDGAKTLNFLQGFWNAHVEDWNSLDLGRHGDYAKPRDPDVFQHPRYDVVNPAQWPVLPLTKGLTFVNAGTDLIYAAFKYAEYTGDRQAAKWGKHLYRQYVLARNPETGMPVYQFSSPLQRQPAPADDNQTQSWYGDRAQRQFGAEFGEMAREANVLFRDMRPLLIDNPLAMLDILRVQPDDEMLGWVISGLKNYYQYAYDLNSNTLRPMWNNGQDMTGYRFKRDGYYGKAGTELKRFALEGDYLLPLVRAYCLSADEDLYALINTILTRLANENARHIASPALLCAMVELAERRQSEKWAQYAWQLAEILFEKHFHRGLFVRSARHRHLRLDDPAPLALSAFIAACRNRLNEIPPLLTQGGYVHGDFRVNGENKIIYDVEFIYPELLKA
ncbi:MULTISPECIES: pectate disaccharide-lyase PelW [Brenneria]|uniref:Pectate lyase n=1 Tax=Brenneria nigrifluens DSM 30175 = ATCC 13028 TaxID=1121120 RepID=A0A2U1UT33_9GAMM|nr:MULTISPECIES: pectate disaccharide-lyase PelW [Brenneria]EHD21670.1 Pectate disaccharide-lyase [Brenneria sp. EniD312]PWC24792.1 pectate lyase [Brenneria nigrifluens] [Brenneria nigrifluens DSM 30175 = ATCC 13028]QCR04786.1 pectate lyase [Brenneria nigrifluens] [Brenneria nigrifluens DSM 30175 = ATCC 13028]